MIRRKGDRLFVEVWNPFVRKYQPVSSVDEGVNRVGGLANLIGRMWLERHPKRDLLMDVPVAAEFNDGNARKSKLSRLLTNGPRLLDLPFDHLTLRLDQFQFGQPQQIADMIDCSGPPASP